VSVLYRQANQGCHFNICDNIILVRHLYISPNELNSLAHESSLLVPLLKVSTYKQCRNISDGGTFQIKMFYLQLLHAISFVYFLKHLFTCTGTEIFSLITLKTVTHVLIGCDRDVLSHHKHILMIKYIVVLDEDLGKKCGLCL